MSKNDLVDADIVDTRVGSAVLVKGDIEGDGNVVVEGRVEGKIAIKGDLQVAVDGQVKSSVSARNILVQGILVGSVSAIDKVEIAAGGRMVGDVRTPRFLINEGAAYKGTVDMVGFEPGEAGADKPRAARSGPSPRRQQPAPAAAVRSAGANGARESVPGPTPRPAPSRQAAAASVYAPPPVARPPEFVGVKKAIIIKKKSEENV